MFKINNEKGAMALSSILALSIILLALGLAMSFTSFIENNIVYNQNKASNAFYVAEAGARDAIEKVVRNKNFSNGGYSLAMAGGSATIVVNKDVPAAERTEILSTGVSGANTKKIRVVLNTDANNDNNGKVTIESWEECQKSGALCN